MNCRILCNRSVEFRGKRKDNGEWVYGYYVKLEDKHYIFTGKILRFEDLEVKECFEVIQGTVGLYTGLYDSTKWEELTEEEREKWILYGNTPSDYKGKKIYENDLIGLDVGVKIYYSIFIVKFGKYIWQNGEDFPEMYGFYLKGINGYAKGLCYNILDYSLGKKIGNIYENIDLLEVKR